jgi:hypothetical protein
MKTRDRRLSAYGLRKSADHKNRKRVTGRVEVVPLYPLGRSERLRAKVPQFISKIFRGQLMFQRLPILQLTSGDGHRSSSIVDCHQGFRCGKYLLRCARLCRHL